MHHSPLGTARIWADNDAVSPSWDVHFYVRDHQRLGPQVVHWDVEEPLNLAGVQVHGDDVVAASDDNHVGDQLRSDRRARFVFLVHPGVGEARDDRGDPAGRCRFAGGYEDEELHEHIVYVPAARLDDEDVLVTNGF